MAGYKLPIKTQFVRRADLVAEAVEEG